MSLFSKLAEKFKARAPDAAARREEAEARCRRAATLREQGDVDAALASLREAAALAPDFVDGLNALGNLLAETGRHEEAAAWYRRALAIEPALNGTWNNLGNALLALGKADEAVEAYKTALRLNPDAVEVLYNLSCAFVRLGDLGVVEALSRQVLARDPKREDAWINLGNALLSSGRAPEAMECYRELLALTPDNPAPHNNLANAYKEMGDTERALAHYRRSIELDPDFLPGHVNLGNVFQDQGRQEEAEACFRKSLAIEPAMPDVHSNLLLCLNYTIGDAGAKLFAEHREWARRHAEPLYRTRVFANACGKKRKLRVAYLSPDLRGHPVAFFLEPLLAHHDRERFEITCYADSAREDEVTLRLQKLAGRWRTVVGMADAVLEEKILGDGVDILVDLAGHTGHNRMTLFARRVAPVQVTYLGYPNTTGLATMDYRLTDAWADPPGMTEAFHSEELVRLPGGFLCYRPSPASPAVSASPAAAGRGVTFASFNNYAKMRPDMMALWAELLARVPHSRLVLKAVGLGDAASRAAVAQNFAAHGIGADRLIVHGPAPSFAEHLAFYADVDIALDTYPYNGTTTTCEALWMGVPVVTLAGPAHVARVGASLLNAVGLGELVAATPEDYVAKAAALANDVTALAALRAGMRARMAASPLMDEAGFAHKVEDAYLAMWQRYCAERGK